MKIFTLKQASGIFLAIFLVFSVSTIKSTPASGSSVSGELTLLAPSACPGSRCAAGQRLNLQVNFNITPAAFSSPNLQICVFTPANGGSGNPWADKATFTISASGLKTNLPYTAGETKSVCSNNPNQPAATIFLGGAFTTLPPGITADSLTFGFRINRASSIPGTVIVQIYDPTLPDTAPPAQNFPPLVINVIPPTANVFIADDAAGCGANSPCYMNSTEDLPNGIGTGLKDAIDAVTSPATLNILGIYHIKSNSILINPTVTLQGINNASLVYQGSACLKPMLVITSGLTLKNLTINNSGCSGGARDLITINSAQDVTLQYTTLTGGKNAVTLADNTGNLIAQYNHIVNNQGYAILRLPGASTGVVQAELNNLYNNQNGIQIECNKLGQADHNFVGRNPDSLSAISQCTAVNGKRLGAPIALNPTGPGVDAKLITLTNPNTKSSDFNGAISFQYGGPDPSFSLYVVNHGNGSFENMPFMVLPTSYISPCSNYWDIFLPDKQKAPNSLSVFFRYDLNPACVASVEAATVCAQPDPTKYPLYWYDPFNIPTAQWTTTGGVTGVTTSCDLVTKEIGLAFANTGGHIAFGDLQNLPIVVGFPFSFDIKLTNFTATGSVGQVALQWQTASEYNLSGFFVTRGPASTGPFSRVSNFVPSRGSATIGGLYSFTDPNIPDGSNYFYRLEVVGSNNQVVWASDPKPASTPVSTPTTTLTPTLTFTPTITYTPTMTYTPTVTPTPTVTQTPTSTTTLTPTLTDTPIPTYTGTPTFTATPYRTPTRTATTYYYYTATKTRTPITSTATRTTTLTSLTINPSLSVTMGTQGTPSITPTATQTSGTPKPTSNVAGAYPAQTSAVNSTNNTGYPAQSGTQPESNTSKSQTAAAIKPGSTANNTTHLTQTPVPPVHETPPASQTMQLASLISGAFLGFFSLSVTGFYLFQKRSYQ